MGTLDFCGRFFLLLNGCFAQSAYGDAYRFGPTGVETLAASFPTGRGFGRLTLAFLTVDILLPRILRLTDTRRRTVSSKLIGQVSRGVYVWLLWL